MKEGKLTLSRRNLLRAAAAAGAASLAAACGPTPQPPAATVETAATVPPTASQEAETIIFWEPDTSDQQIARTTPVYMKFNEVQTQYKLDLSHGKNEEAVLAAVAAGTPPDVYWRWNVNTYGSWINKGVIQDLTPFVDASTLDWSRFVPISLESCKWRGKYYGMPLTSAGLGLFYWNKPMLEKAGLDPNTPPKDLDELLAFADKAIVRDDAGNISALGFHWNFGHVEWPPHFNAKFWDPDSEQITPTDPGMVACYQWVADYYDRYGADALDRFFTGFPGGGYYGDAHPLCKDMVASLGGFEWDWPFMTLYAKCEESKFGFGRMLNPAGHPDYPVTGQGTVPVVMPTGAPHPRAGWAYMEYLQTAEAAGEIGAVLVNAAQVKDAIEVPAYANNPVLKLCTEINTSGNVVAWCGPIPVAAEYADELGKAYDLIIHGKVAAEEGLQAVYDRVQPQLDKALGK